MNVCRCYIWIPFFWCPTPSQVEFMLNGFIVQSWERGRVGPCELFSQSEVFFRWGECLASRADPFPPGGSRGAAAAAVRGIPGPDSASHPLGLGAGGELQHELCTSPCVHVVRVFSNTSFYICLHDSFTEAVNASLCCMDKYFLISYTRCMFMGWEESFWQTNIHACTHLSFCLCLCSILEGGISPRTIFCSSCVVYDCIEGDSSTWHIGRLTVEPLMMDHPSLKTPSVNPSLDHFMKMNQHQSSSIFKDSFCKLFTWSFYEAEPITKLRLPFLDLSCGQVGFLFLNNSNPECVGIGICYGHRRSLQWWCNSKWQCVLCGMSWAVWSWQCKCVTRYWGRVWRPTP